MSLRSFKIVKTERIIGYSNNRTTKKYNFILGSRFGRAVLNVIYLKYNLIKLYSLLQTIYSASPAVNIILASENFNFEMYLTTFSKSSLINSFPEWKPNSLQIQKKHEYNWYEKTQSGLIFIPDIYNNLGFVKEAKRLCIPILSLINVNKPISIDYPIYCNAYSNNIVWWFSMYIIKIIQKESSFFRKQKEIYKPKILRDSLDLKQLKLLALKWTSDIVDKKIWKYKLAIWLAKSKRRLLTTERFYWRKVKGQWNNFLYLNYKRKTYYDKKRLFDYKYFIIKYFKNNYLGNSKISTSLIRKLGNNKLYNRWNKWNIIRFLKKITWYEPTPFLYSEIVKIIAKKRVKKGFFFFKKNRLNYINLKQYLQQIFSQRPYRFFYKKKLIYSFCYTKYEKIIKKWKKIKRKIKKINIVENMKNFGLANNRLHTHRHFWIAREQWLRYNLKYKFEYSDTSFWYYITKFFNIFFINPSWKELYVNLTKKPSNLNILINKQIWQNNLTLYKRQNYSYGAQDYIWITHVSNFRQNLNKYTQSLINSRLIKFINYSYREKSFIQSFIYKKYQLNSKEYLFKKFYQKTVVKNNKKSYLYYKIMLINNKLSKLNEIGNLLKIKKKNKKLIYNNKKNKKHIYLKKPHGFKN